MKRTQLILVAALGFSLGAFAETSNHKAKGKTSPQGEGFAARTKTVAVTEAPTRFQEVIDILGAEKDGKPLAIWCGTGYLHENDYAKKLKGQFETILKYRQSLNSCNDELNNQVKIFLDEYIETIVVEDKRDKYGKTLEGIENPSKNLSGLNSALRFHEPLKKFLELKVEKLADKKDAFEKADAALFAALDSVLEICVAKEFKPSSDDRTTQKIDEFNAQVANQTKDGFKEEHACNLEVEDPAAPVIDDRNNSTTPEDGTDSTDSDGEAPEHTDAPPVGEDPSAGTGAETGQGGAQGAVQPQLPPLAQQGFGLGNQAVFDPNAAQLQDLSDREADALRGQAELLQQALAQATRPNRVGGSPDNSRSFAAPPVSVSPQPGNQSQQQPQQQPYPPMQIPPFQPVPIPAAAPIPPELLSALARSNSTPRVDPNAAAASQAMMEMARLQQQMMQAQMANQMNMNNQGLNRNANRIRNRSAFRGNRGRAGARFMSQGRRSMGRNLSGARSSSRIAR